MAWCLIGNLYILGPRIGIRENFLTQWLRSPEVNERTVILMNESVYRKSILSLFPICLPFADVIAH